VAQDPRRDSQLLLAQYPRQAGRLAGKTIPLWFQVEDRGGKNYNCRYDGTKKQWIDGYDPVADSDDVHEQYWELACAEFCGSRHSLMRGKMFVHKDRADYLGWLRSVEERFKTGVDQKSGN